MSAIVTTNQAFGLDVLLSVLRGEYIGKTTFFAVFQLVKHLGCPKTLELFAVQILPHAVNYCKPVIEAQQSVLALLANSISDTGLLLEAARAQFGDTLELSGTGPRADVVL